jgi:serine/threonine protein kinase
MARIYEATDTKLGRTAAVKVLNVEGSADTTLAQRFQREARAVAKLEHDNIIRVYQYGEEVGWCYIAMKLVDGKDLAQELARLRRSGSRMEPARALHLLGQIASAIDFAHQRGIIHRDIKPSNILIDKTDHAVLTDFGLLLQSTEDATKTQGTAFGTPRYIAPEQALASANAVPQSDIYALAVILYEILTGEPPFSGETPMEIALGHIGDPPRPPRSINPKIPVGVERELLKALEKEPPRRHQNATEFISAVKAAYSTEQPAALKVAALPPPPVITRIDEVKPSKPKPGADLNATPREPAAAVAVIPPAIAEAPRRRRMSPLLLLLLLALLLVAGGWGVMQFLSSQNVSISANGTLPVSIFLWYDENSFIIHNGTGRTIDMFPVQFIRGVDGGNDDYAGDRVSGTNDEIPAGECFVIYRQEFAPPLPPECTRRFNFEALFNARLFFWRSETAQADTTYDTFQVWYNRVPVATCETVAEGEGRKTCAFAWQEVQPTATPVAN